MSPSPHSPTIVRTLPISPSILFLPILLILPTSRY